MISARPARGISLAGVIACMTLAPALAADPAPPMGVVVEGPSGAPTTLVPEDPALARSTASLSVEHGKQQAEYEGPLLWSVLERAGAVAADKPSAQVRQTVLVTGRDGYTAVLALGEISPDFAGKPVILADRMDGKPLGPEHLRLVVPGERRGGRSVRDVVRITVGPAVPTAR